MKPIEQLQKTKNDWQTKAFFFLIALNIFLYTDFASQLFAAKKNSEISIGYICGKALWLTSHKTDSHKTWSRDCGTALGFGSQNLDTILPSTSHIFISTNNQYFLSYLKNYKQIIFVTFPSGLSPPSILVLS